MTYLYLQWKSRFCEARVLFSSELMIHTFRVYVKINDSEMSRVGQFITWKKYKRQRHHDMTSYIFIFFLLLNLCFVARVVHVIVLCRTWHLTSDIVSQYSCLNVFCLISIFVVVWCTWKCSSLNCENCDHFFLKTILNSDVLDVMIWRSWLIKRISFHDRIYDRTTR